MRDLKGLNVHRGMIPMQEQSGKLDLENRAMSEVKITMTIHDKELLAQIMANESPPTIEWIAHYLSYNGWHNCADISIRVDRGEQG